MYEVITYKDNAGRDEISDYMQELFKKSEHSKIDRIKLDKIVQYLLYLEKMGTRIGAPFVKHIEGDIWELRPTDDRIFFFYWKNKTFVLLHHFKKMTQKTPKKEIEQAKRNMQNFLKRGDK
jgi:phage-related protein